MTSNNQNLATPPQSTNLSPVEISRELQLMRLEVKARPPKESTSEQMGYGDYAKVLMNSAPPPRELDPDIFARQLATLIAEYPVKACAHVVREYPRKNATCSIKRIADALDDAKYEMESAIAQHEALNRQIGEQPEQDAAEREEARIAASWETPQGKKLLAEIKERVAKRKSSPLDRATLAAHDEQQVI